MMLLITLLGMQVHLGKASFAKVDVGRGSGPLLIVLSEGRLCDTLSDKLCCAGSAYYASGERAAA